MILSYTALCFACGLATAIGHISVYHAAGLSTVLPASSDLLPTPISSMVPSGSSCTSAMIGVYALRNSLLLMV